MRFTFLECGFKITFLGIKCSSKFGIGRVGSDESLLRGGIAGVFVYVVRLLDLRIYFLAGEAISKRPNSSGLSLKLENFSS